jgi:hypothetical protein
MQPIPPPTATASRALIPTAALLALALLACGSLLAAQGAEEEQAVTVTALIYSGRPNPTAALDDATVARLGELLAAAPAVEATDPGTVFPSTLGYNGVAVDNPAGRGGLPLRLAAYGGTIEIGEGRARSFRRDEGVAIESLLIDAAAQAGALDEHELEFIREERAEREKRGH